MILSKEPPYKSAQTTYDMFYSPTDKYVLVILFSFFFNEKRGLETKGNNRQVKERLSHMIHTQTHSELCQRWAPSSMGYVLVKSQLAFWPNDKLCVWPVTKIGCTVLNLTTPLFGLYMDTHVSICKQLLYMRTCYFFFIWWWWLQTLSTDM